MKKGDTLIEVIVAMFIFSTVIASSISLYTGMITFYNTDNSYVHFESICQDIDKYYDHYGTEWKEECFGVGGSNRFYFTTSFEQCEKDDATYEVTIGYKLDGNDFKLIAKNLTNNSVQTFEIETLSEGNNSVYYTSSYTLTTTAESASYVLNVYKDGEVISVSVRNIVNGEAKTSIVSSLEYDDNLLYFDNAYQRCDNVDAAYALQISYGSVLTDLQICVRRIENGKLSNKYIIDNLEYGDSKYCSVLENIKDALVDQYYYDHNNDNENKTEFIYNDTIEPVIIWGEIVYRYGETSQKVFEQNGKTASGNTFYKIENVSSDTDINNIYKISYLDAEGKIKGVITYEVAKTQ